MPAALPHTMCSRMVPRRTRLGLRLIVVALLAWLPAGAQAAAPANDDFADAQVVRVGDRVTGTTAEATLEAGEPAPSSALLMRSTWYRYDASTTEPLRIDSCSSARYAELAIYTGAGVGALTEVADTTRAAAPEAPASTSPRRPARRTTSGSPPTTSSTATSC